MQRIQGGASVKQRSIIQAETRDKVGCVTWTYERARPWFPWLTRSTLALYETEDFSLVCTARPLRIPFRSWSVSDADGNDVGIFGQTTVKLSPQLAELWQIHDARGLAAKQLSGILIKDRFGQDCAMIEFPPGHLEGRVLAVGCPVLATLYRSGAGMRVQFVRGQEGEPFTRMVIVTALALID